MKIKIPSSQEVEKYREKIRKFSNSAQYVKAQKFAHQCQKKYPGYLLFDYWDAVFTAEESKGFTKSQNAARYRLATKKFQKLLKRLHGVPGEVKNPILNEYYWFSKQPKKQFRHGQRIVKKFPRSGFYSMGVGASHVALDYGMKGKMQLCRRWALKSIKAWEKYFIIMPNWFNSYLFYGKALGLMGKEKEMMRALEKGARIAGLRLKDEPFQKVIGQVAGVRGSAEVRRTLG